MEFPVSFSTTISLIVVALLMLLQIFKRKKANKEPPQAKGAWPIIGHLHLLGGSQPPQKVLGDMADIHGHIFTIKLGVHQALLVSKSEIAKECFTTNDKAFADRPRSLGSEILGYNYAMFGLAPYGDYWRQVRKIIMLEVLSQRRVEMMEHVRVSELRASMKDIYDAWLNKKEKESPKMVKVEMKQWFGNLILNTVIRVISGETISLNDEDAVRFRIVARKFIELLGEFVVSDFIPCLKFLDLGGYEKAMKMTKKEMDDIFDRWLEEHKKAKGSVQQHEGDQGFIHVLISILEGASEEDFSAGFDHDTIIKSSCLAILIAALDTTSLSLTWALSLLLNNQNALKLAQDEIDEHVGKERLVEESDVKNLVYLDAIIKETLRLYPAAALSIPRESTEDCIINGYNIPKGTRLLVNLWKMHRDPNIWSYPNEFRPERFLTCQKDIDVKGKHYELLPFGSGRRICPGISFVLQAMPLTLASLIQQFVIKKPSDEPIDMSESPGLTTIKTLPLEVLLSPRLSHDMYSYSIGA